MKAKHWRLWLAGVSIGLTIAYVAFAVVAPDAATPLGFAYMGTLFLLHCLAAALRRS